MNVCELMVGIAAVANSIACQLSDEELEVTAAAIEHLADTLGTIAVLRALERKRREGDSDTLAEAAVIADIL